MSLEQSTNKRIDFDNKTLKKIDMMIPHYRDDLDSAQKSDHYNYVLKLAVDCLFSDFLKKMEKDQF